MKTRNLLIAIVLIMILGLFVSGTHSKRTHDVIFEAPIELEDWMTQPFDTNEYLAEGDIAIEDWMTEPFV